MATEYSLLIQNGTANAYWTNLHATDGSLDPYGNYKNRYLVSGSTYRVFATINAWMTYVNTLGNKNVNNDIILEIYGAWLDTSLFTSAINGYKSIKCHSKINGIRTTAFPGGIVGSGYRNIDTTAGNYGWQFSQPNVTVDGVEVRNTSGSTSARGAVTNLNISPNFTVVNCILQNGYAVTTMGSNSLIFNNIFVACTVAGYAEPISTDSVIVAFNLAYGCAIGFSGANLSASRMFQSRYFGNIAVGNTINWGNFNATDGNNIWRYVAGYNIGDSTDKIAVTFTNADECANTVAAHGMTINTPVVLRNAGGATAPTGLSFDTQYYIATVPTANKFTLTLTRRSVTPIAISDDGTGSIYFSRVWDTLITEKYATSADFVDSTNATLTSRNYYPALSSSAQVSLISFLDSDGLPRYDIADHFRPDYEIATFTTPGNKATAGPFEFQHNNSADGRPPYYPVITISANTSLSGAEIRIYDLNNSPAGSLGTELLGIESHTSSAYIISTLNTGNLIWIQIMQSGYEEFGMEYTIPATDTALPITLKADLNA